MNSKSLLAALTVVMVLTACEGAFLRRRDTTRDYGFDAKPLSQLKAGIWVDPNGCDHWIIDDGVEGYLSTRLDRDGKPVCSGEALANQAYGDFKSGSPFSGAF